MGQLTNIAGLDEYDASDFYVVGRFQPIKSGNLGELLFYKRDRQVNWASEDLENEFPPDAIFSLGSFVRGAEALKKIR
jgi:hypothetical protein